MAFSFEALDPGLADDARALDSVVYQSGLQGRFTSGLRTRAEQTRLYNRFLAGQSQFPAAPPGASAHEYGWAFDYVVVPEAYQTAVGQFWASFGLGWSESDAIHFELPGASAEAMRRYNAGLSGVDPYQKLAQDFDNATWYIQLLEPWELWVYNHVPGVKGLINPAYPIDKIKAIIAAFR